MATTFPNGYGKQLLTLDDLRGKHGAKMHPEYARRLFACLADADGLVGIGGGWRSTKMQAESYARAPNTFAPPGLSFHETHRFASGTDAYVAVDTVGRDGRHDEAWNWMRDNAGRFGLRTFWNVNGEPWHVQFSDLPNGVSSWKAAGCPDPSQFPLPGGAASTSVPLATSAGSSGSSGSPGSTGYGAHPLNDDKPVIQNGWHGDLVRYAQLVISNEAGGRITVDGDFGPKTEGRVKDVQFFFELPPTGRIDWNGTWQILDHLAGHPRPAAPDRGGPVTEVDRGYYWVQRGDSPWSVAERVYGRGVEHSRFDPCDPAEPGFSAADHVIRLPGVVGRTTVVGPGEQLHSIIRRLAPGRDPAELVDRFHALNGGVHRSLRPGEVVFLDDPTRAGQPA